LSSLESILNSLITCDWTSVKRWTRLAQMQRKGELLTKGPNTMSRVFYERSSIEEGEGLAKEGGKKGLLDRESYDGAWKLANRSFIVRCREQRAQGMRPTNHSASVAAQKL